MPYTLDDKLVIGISSRALFDLMEADNVFKDGGLSEYRLYQREHENEPLSPGTGFQLVQSLLAVNQRSPERLVEVIVMSRNDADSAMRIFNSAEAHGLDVTRGALTGGSDPWPYLKPFMASLFLSAEPNDVVSARDRGFPAALVLEPPTHEEPKNSDGGVRIAFDGDAVLFDEESERVYRDEGHESFMAHEVAHADEPMNPGPFRPFFVALKRIQDAFPDGESPIRSALVTSRNAPAHRRVVNTFRAWGIQTDEAYFLGGIEKHGVLEVFKPHIFFDDQRNHLEQARERVPVAQVIPVYEQPTLFPEGDLPARAKSKPHKVESKSGSEPRSSKRGEKGPTRNSTGKAVPAPAPTPVAGDERSGVRPRPSGPTSTREPSESDETRAGAHKVR